MGDRHARIAHGRVRELLGREVEQAELLEQPVHRDRDLVATEQDERHGLLIERREQIVSPRGPGALAGERHELVAVVALELRGRRTAELHVAITRRQRRPAQIRRLAAADRIDGRAVPVERAQAEVLDVRVEHGAVLEPRGAVVETAPRWPSE